MDNEIELKHQYKLRQKYTALWAFSESVLGGMLHAFKIPFTGLILGGFAVIFLSLISDVSKSKKDILKVTSIVIVIKFMISPNTPFTAYLAVFIQGFFAYLIFSFIKNRPLAIFILSFLSALWSASQKIIVTTLIFGMTFWYSLDELTLYLSRIIGLNLGENFSMSLVLITVYFLLHLSGAILFARLAIHLPDFLRRNESRLEVIRKNYIIHNDKNFKEENSLTKKKKWYRKPSRIILLFILLVVAFVTYLNPGLSKIKFIDVISMLARAIVLIYVWFKIVSPLLVKTFVRLVGNNSNWKFIDEYTSFFPEFKQIILFSWKSNPSQIKMVRIKKFLEDALLLLLK